MTSRDRAQTLAGPTIPEDVPYFAPVPPGMIGPGFQGGFGGPVGPGDFGGGGGGFGGRGPAGGFGGLDSSEPGPPERPVMTMTFGPGSDGDLTIFVDGERVHEDEITKLVGDRVAKEPALTLILKGLPPESNEKEMIEFIEEMRGVGLRSFTIEP